MTVYLTSDTHYGHKNIITYCGRPYTRIDGQPDVAAMTEGLIDRYNARVRPKDTVYHLGDFAFLSLEKMAEVLKRLNGKKILIRGNHDKGLKQMVQAGFDAAHNYLWTRLEGKMVLLIHEPVEDWRKKNKYIYWPNGLDQFPNETPNYQLCGHVHKKWSSLDDIINVGVDVRDYEPKTFAELTQGIKCNETE